MRRTAGHRSARDGFALVEVTLALMLIAILAAIALPGLVRGTGSASLRVTAFEVSAVLREDRNAAMRTGRAVTTRVAAAGVHSGASDANVASPIGVAFKAPARFRFTPDGRASGGDIVIASDRARLVVTVSPDTGGIRVLAP